MCTNRRCYLPWEMKFSIICDRSSPLSSCRKWPAPLIVTCSCPLAPGTIFWKYLSPPRVIGSRSLKAVRNGFSHFERMLSQTFRFLDNSEGTKYGMIRAPALYVSSGKGASYALITSDDRFDTVAICKIGPIGSSGTVFEKATHLMRFECSWSCSCVTFPKRLICILKRGYPNMALKPLALGRPVLAAMILENLCGSSPTTRRPISPPQS